MRIKLTLIAIAALTLCACDIPNADITGTITYDKVSHDPQSNGLDYTTTQRLPVRGVIIEALENGQVIDTTSSDEQGHFKFVIKMDKRIQLRTRSQFTTATGTVKVVDNTQQDAIYVLQSPEFKVNKETLQRDLHASSGWNGSGYNNVRAAAPFHILDSIYDIHQKIENLPNTFNLPELTINWSINNIPEFGDEATGQIGTSFYRNGQIFLLGAQDIDTDEYDSHVIIHEWGHFFEDNLSRSDSIGGPHGGGDRLDMRVAFGEGFGNAWAAMITDNPLYRDSLGSLQSNGFVIDIEANDIINPGWYSEGSVQSILYDIYDQQIDGVDGFTLGLEPIVDILTSAHADSEALTSIFTFISYLKQNYPEQTANIDALLEQQQINSDINIWASREDNDANSREVLPVYYELQPAQKTTVCTTLEFGSQGNKLSNHRFTKLNITNPGNYQLSIIGDGNVDIDAYAYYQGQLIGFNEDFGTENFTLDLQLTSGVSVIDTLAYVADGSQVTGSCFDLSLTQN